MLFNSRSLAKQMGIIVEKIESLAANSSQNIEDSSIQKMKQEIEELRKELKSLKTKKP